MRNDFKSNYLAHHGILGQKWGVRRYQNPDGSLTAEGKRHQKQLQNDLESGKVSREQLESELRSTDKTNWNRQLNSAIDHVNTSEYAQRYQQAFNTSAALDADAMATNAALGFGAVPLGRGSAEVALRLKELQDYGERYINEHIDDFSSAALKDLGYEDTQAGREYLKKIGILNWSV